MSIKSIAQLHIARGKENQFVVITLFITKRLITFELIGHLLKVYVILGNLFKNVVPHLKTKIIFYCEKNLHR